MSRNLGCLALCVAAVAALSSCPALTDPPSPGSDEWTYTVTSTPADGVKTLDQSPAISWSVSGVTAISWQIRVADSVSGLSSALSVDPANAVFSDADAGYPWTAGIEIPLVADPGTTKYWQIRFDEGTGYSVWSPAYSFTVSQGVLISLLSPTDLSSVANTTPMLDWADVAGANSYDLYITDLSDGSSSTDMFQYADNSYLNLVSWPGTLEPATNYAWKVLARNSDGGMTPWCSEFHFSTP